MTKQFGTLNGHPAERYSDGSVFYHVAGHWYRSIGQESKFKPN